ncbi:uncharacterized protein LOC128240196 [Mya arenaria]|uniref:uncharacterized protein LOC128240196 n=1 Tax=Mya arenaria TaxID=6604 RepID=UPI0022E79754|nr:uncharacterized protein LOC128240196 [Mya arenaria]
MKKKNISQILVRIFGEELKKKISTLPDDTCEALKDVVEKLVKRFQEKVDPIEAKYGCVCIFTRFYDFVSYMSFLDDLLNGKLTEMLHPLQDTLRSCFGVEDLLIEFVIHEDEFLDCIENTVNCLKNVMKTTHVNDHYGNTFPDIAEQSIVQLDEPATEGPDILMTTFYTELDKNSNLTLSKNDAYKCGHILQYAIETFLFDRYRSLPMEAEKGNIQTRKQSSENLDQEQFPPGKAEVDNLSKNQSLDEALMPKVTITWRDCLQRRDVSAAITLIHQGVTPDSYSTFEQAIQLLSSAKEAQRELCKVVCDNIQQFRKAENMYVVFDYTSQKPLIVAIPLSDNKDILGYPLLSKDKYAIGDEDRSVREKEIKNKKRILTRESEKKMNAAVRSAQRRFHEWPNFSRISHSFYRSKGYKTDESLLEEKECIVLYVFVKGLIPIGWDPFPKEFEGYEVDVRESMPIILFLKPISSEMLCSHCGTLQSPVPGRTDELLALTAGHVILSTDERDDKTRPVYTRKKSKGYRQLQEDSDIEIVFGNVKINEEGDEAFADVAVVQLKTSLALKLTETRWDELGFIRNPTFDSHVDKCFDVYNGDIVMKYGESTQLTLGRVRYTCNGYKGRLSMIEIEPYGTNRKFSEPGDSGAYVFALNRDIFGKQTQKDERFAGGQDAFLIGIVHGGNEDIFYCTNMIANIAGLRLYTNLIQ